MKIHILSHRGYWKNIEEKNSEVAFARSFGMAFGTETDVRDMAGEIVVSHDPPIQGAMLLDTLFTEYRRHDVTLPLALNIKSDGLQNMLLSALRRHGIENYFVFDMSVPDTISYINSGMSVFTRQSEYEAAPPFYHDVKGIWLDSFVNEWMDEKVINDHIANGKLVCIVSPELHKRPYLPFWIKLRGMSIIHSKSLMLCTDHPEEARAFFHEEN